MLKRFHSLGRRRIVVPFVNPNAAEPKIFENEQAIRDFQRLQTHRSISHQGGSRSETICQTQCALTTDSVQSQANRLPVNRVFHLVAKIFAIDQNDMAALGPQFID